MDASKFNIRDFRWSGALDGMMADAHIIEPDWKRCGRTGAHHPLGENLAFIVAEVYSNGTFRQIVQVGPTWWDCLMSYQDERKLEVLEKRIVTIEKAAHVADSYGITLTYSDGTPVRFDKDVQPKKEENQMSRKSKAQPTESTPGSDAAVTEAAAEVQPVEDAAATPAPVKKATTPKVDFPHAPVSNLVEFTAELMANYPDAAANISNLMAYFGSWKTSVGNAPKFAAMAPFILVGKVEVSPLYFNTNGRVEVSFSSLVKRVPFSDPVQLESFRLALPEGVAPKAEGKPSFLISKITDEAFYKQLVEALDLFKALALAEAAKVVDPVAAVVAKTAAKKTASKKASKEAAPETPREVLPMSGASLNAAFEATPVNPAPAETTPVDPANPA